MTGTENSPSAPRSEAFRATDDEYPGVLAEAGAAREQELGAGERGGAESFVAQVRRRVRRRTRS